MPTAGAVVKVKFNNNNQNNKSVIARIKTDSGNFIPFGARLYDESDNIYGTSGQGGITILSLPDEFKLLKVTWLENGNIVSCHISPSELENSIASMKAELTTVDLRCHKK
ncbi:FimD/PapC C-terminal domain-containing protein [Erwinia tracheiphila]